MSDQEEAETCNQASVRKLCRGIVAVTIETVTNETATNSGMRTVLNFEPRQRRRVLCAFPRYGYSFGTFNHAFPLIGVKGFMPPQGILLIVELIPPQWEVRFIDENIKAITTEDFAWAEVVFVSGMHIQREYIRDLTRRAHQAGKVVVLGGPSVSSAPEYYPEVDILHRGEVGDGTLKLFQRWYG